MEKFKQRFSRLQSNSQGNINTTFNLSVMVLAVNLCFYLNFIGLVNTMNRQGVNNLYANIVIEPANEDNLISNANRL